ncbi:MULTISPECIES: ABC transporter permease [unclassified Clostridium]|uniref:ABC transporter permease n=1 Tax=Clostridium TaxID=1485 RepID=UPI001C8CEF68|nr:MULTISPECIES: ABC transporter permease [unclassified Clostridium]MBX9136494.1 ABC transporter permease [Clostridium sp. K12(2020)]MBX9143025.1 ABC transporter permease [Clostridium sp. K13]MDU2291131.1 ABC transporter permease [Clostridium celatum]
MIRSLKHIIRIILIFALIMCWGISLGYANNIESKDKIINFYFENDNYTVGLLESIGESKKELSFVGWREESLQSVTNPDLNRTANDLDILLINGSSNLLVKGSMLFKDDKEGCLIDEETSFKLFGSSNCLGRTIVYNEKSLIVRGILKGTKANMMLQLPEDSNLALKGLTIDGTGLTINKIEEFKSQFGIQEMAINGGIYYIIAKTIAIIFPILALILILIKIIISIIKSRKKPILVVIYLFMIITSIFIVFKITNIKISIPLDMIPNKWSDFDFWSKMWKQYSEKIQYVMYMKKSGIDIYNIENLLKSVLFSIFTIILFVINLNVIKIKDIKELIINNAISIICTFIAVLIIWTKFNFDVNITMLWLIYPLYLCADYFMKSHHKHLICDEVLESNTKITNEICL